MPTGRTTKGVDPVKMLAFERLATLGVKPLEIRRILGLAESTYRLYSSRFRRSQAESIRDGLRRAD